MKIINVTPNSALRVGPCESHDDSPQGYFCLDGQITDAVGRECHATHDTASDSCSVAGLFCDIGTNTCYRSYDEPRVIYNPIHHSCIAHFDCDEGFHCLREGTDSQYGTCEVCQIGTHCPDKGSPNVPTCKRAEYNCADVCILIDKECSTTDLEKGKCCLGLKCGEEGVCVRDECKKSGSCVDDSEGCVNYGCWNSVVVGIVEQRCSSENGLASPNCVGGTFCNTDTDICLCPTGKKKKVTYNPWLYMPCEAHILCDIGLYCGNGMCQNCATIGGCTAKEEKIELNTPTCIFEDDKCLSRNKCVTFGADKVEGFSCCRGLKENNEGKCTTCKMSGACNNEEDDICDYYGCMDNKVVYAQQIECETVDDCPRNDYSAFNDKNYL